MTIDSAELKITSDECEIDLKKNVAVFKGNVHYLTKGEKDISGSCSTLTVDMTLGKIKITDNEEMTISTSDRN